jgi:polyisoprenoid-binding protein YceI
MFAQIAHLRGLMSLLGLLLYAFGPALSAHAQPASGVDTAASRVYIKVAKATRLGHEHGVEGRLASGKLTWDAGGELTFDMTSFVADTPQARQYVGLDAEFSASDARKVNANMRGAEVLDVANYPRAVFAIARVQPSGGQAAGEPGRYQVEGSFTLHGVRRSIQFPATLERADGAGNQRLRGSFTIQQTDYGIQPYSALGGLIRVADALEIWGDLVLTSAAR